MEQYTYLLLGLTLLAPLMALLLWRKDLAPKAIKLGLCGGVAGLLAEFIYFLDYWRPPTLLGVAKISPEDFLFGFTITALSVVVFAVLARRRFANPSFPQRKRLYVLFFALSVAALVQCSLGLGVNSIFVSSAIFALLAGVMLYMRRDLLWPALGSLAILMTYILAVYAVLFNVLAPEFWNKYWLLAGTPWGVTVLGNIPLTELMWYASWILFASVSYPFATGRALKPLASDGMQPG